MSFRPFIPAVLLRQIAIICIVLFATRSMAHGGPNDSLHLISRKSVIQNMNREQLNALVDYLLELDTIPAELVAEIRQASAKILGNRTGYADGKVFPAADLYVSWEINSLFPTRDLLHFSGDTSVTLTLQGGNLGKYNHPCMGPVTSGFGWRDSTQHNGIDIDLNKGDRVTVAFDGMVRVARNYGGFGNVVIVRHYNGLETVYAHLSRIKVKPGQVVTAGQMIGLGGSTGHSTGSHLHFEIRFKGVPINPKYVISFSEHCLLAEQVTIRKTRWGLAAYPPGVKNYTVEKGDTVFEIAKRFGITTASVRELNGLTGRGRLKAGQVINVAQ